MATSFNQSSNRGNPSFPSYHQLSYSPIVSYSYSNIYTHMKGVLCGFPAWSKLTPEECLTCYSTPFFRFMTEKYVTSRENFGRLRENLKGAHRGNFFCSV